MNIDEAWQLWENTFTAITKQRFPEGVLPRERLPWVTAGTRHAIGKHNFVYRKLAK